MKFPSSNLKLKISQTNVLEKNENKSIILDKKGFNKVLQTLADECPIVLKLL